MMVYLIKDILLLLVVLFFIACSLTTFLPEDPSLDSQTNEVYREVDESNALVVSMVPDRSTN